VIVEQVDDAFEQETKIPMTRTAIERLSVDQIAWLTGEQPPTPLIIRGPQPKGYLPPDDSDL